tara:strand:- start:20 stop:358 length:339 start_codon:yes stop_codon:yes gene_type:complete
MIIKGKITKELTPQTGEGKNGTWTKREFVLSTNGEYPKEVCFEIWKEEIPSPKVGQEIEAHIEIASREYNSKYYTNVKCWKYEALGTAAVVPNGQVVAASNTVEETENDLPF